MINPSVRRRMFELEAKEKREAEEAQRKRDKIKKAEEKLAYEKEVKEVYGPLIELFVNDFEKYFMHDNSPRNPVQWFYTKILKRVRETWRIRNHYISFPVDKGNSVFLDPYFADARFMKMFNKRLAAEGWSIKRLVKEPYNQYSFILTSLRIKNPAKPKQLCDGEINKHPYRIPSKAVSGQ